MQAPLRRLSSVIRGQSSAATNETIWALKDVSFEVQRGEVVGIPSQTQDRHRAQWRGEDDTAQNPHHSSGTYVRLAFAVAAHRSAERSRRSLEPEILL